MNSFLASKKVLYFGLFLLGPLLLGPFVLYGCVVWALVVSRGVAAATTKTEQGNGDGD